MRCPETIHLLQMFVQGDTDIDSSWGGGWVRTTSDCSALPCLSSGSRLWKVRGHWCLVEDSCLVSVPLFPASLLLDSCSCFLPVGGMLGLAKTNKNYVVSSWFDLAGPVFPRWAVLRRNSLKAVQGGLPVGIPSGWTEGHLVFTVF